MAKYYFTTATRHGGNRRRIGAAIDLTEQEAAEGLTAGWLSETNPTAIPAPAGIDGSVIDAEGFAGIQAELEAAIAGRDKALVSLEKQSTILDVDLKESREALETVTAERDAVITERDAALADHKEAEAAWAAEIKKRDTALEKLNAAAKPKAKK